MNKDKNIARQRSIDAALGSVRAEGLNPSQDTQKQLQNYADGKISAKTLRSSVTGKFTNNRTK